MIASGKFKHWRASSRPQSLISRYWSYWYLLKDYISITALLFLMLLTTSSLTRSFLRRSFPARLFFSDISSPANSEGTIAVVMSFTQQKFVSSQQSAIFKANMSSISVDYSLLWEFFFSFRFQRVYISVQIPILWNHFIDISQNKASSDGNTWSSRLTNLTLSPLLPLNKCTIQA